MPGDTRRSPGESVAEGSEIVTAAGSEIESHRNTASDARSRVRAELAERRAELDRLRAERDGLNDEIRTCVADVETLASAVALFDRRARAEAEARNPGRAPRGGAS